MSSNPGRPANRLIDENSPYLLAHAQNPVDWYPWGEEALHRSRVEDKPIFLSIGYASCHWCHVMERESFESEPIAEFLNEHFVCIKVDREQRPDLDHIYMTFTQALSGSGGWPMSVFLTPQLKPFFAGTYFPPDERYGRPGFARVIREIAGAYREERRAVDESADDIFDKISRYLNASTPPATITPGLFGRAAEALLKSVDPLHGGIGMAPKFPHALELGLFLRQYKVSGDLRFLQAAEKGLQGMARGGIYDHLAGGFARYSVDREWLVPHFEKMLYDNALLACTYADAWQITGNELFRGVVRGILDWVLTEMQDDSGGIYSALDADSEGVEGKFYVWDRAEIEQLLGGQAELFCAYYNVRAGGNWEGRNILHVTSESDRLLQLHGAELTSRLAEGRARLLEARSKRIRPLTDDKLLASWNGLMLSGVCRGYQITGDSRYLAAAVAAGEFLINQMLHEGRLTHSMREGRRSMGEFLEDYAFVARGLLDLYESDPSEGNHRWVAAAESLARRGIELFMSSSGELFLRPDGEADLIVRPKEEHDSSLPAPGSIMIGNLVRLHRLTADEMFAAAASRAIDALSGSLERSPGAMTSALMALDQHLADKIDVVIVGSGPVREAMLDELYRRYLPNRLLAIGTGSDGQLPLFHNRRAEEGSVAAYICVNSTCGLPAVTLEEFHTQLDRL